MKKTYISPETIVLPLMPVGIMAMSTHDEIGNGQLTKEYSYEGSSSDNGGSKSVWDEEW